MVAGVHGAVAEPALVQQLEINAHALGQGPLPIADDYGVDEQVELADQPRSERVRRRLGPPTDRSLVADALSGGPPPVSKVRPSRTLVVGTVAAILGE